MLEVAAPQLCTWLAKQLVGLAPCDEFYELKWLHGASATVKVCAGTGPSGRITPVLLVLPHFPCLRYESCAARPMWQLQQRRRSALFTNPTHCVPSIYAASNLPRHPCPVAHRHASCVASLTQRSQQRRLSGPGTGWRRRRCSRCATDDGHSLLCWRAGALDIVPILVALMGPCICANHAGSQVLALRGLLAYDLLQHALQKRHLVNYGVNR